MKNDPGLEVVETLHRVPMEEERGGIAGFVESAPLLARSEAFGTRMLLERAVALLLFGLLVLGVLIVLRPLGTAIVFGAVLAISIWPLRMLLVRAGLKRGAAATLIFIAVLVLIVVPVLFIAPTLSTKAAEGVHELQDGLAALPDAPPDWLARLPGIGKRIDTAWRNIAATDGDLRAALTPYAEWISSTFVGAARAMADSALQFLLALIVAAMFWTTGEAVTEALRDIMRRLGGEPAEAAVTIAGASLRSVAYGVVGTAVLQGVLMGVGAALAGVPAPVLLGFVTVLLAISQVGAPLIVLVWGGSAWYLYRTGETGWSIFILLWGLVLVTGSDNILRPWLIGKGVRMPLTLVIVGVFGGFLSLGFLGLFVGPALIAVAFNLLKSWREGSTSGPPQVEIVPTHVQGSD